ncbi:MAG: biotin/lipoyl-containing protein [Pseudomonadota bacterium]
MPKIRLKLPKLDMSMEEAAIAEWLVKTGDRVTKGQAMYLVESDKAATEVECPIDGTVTVIGEVGVPYKIGHIVAEIDTGS